MYQINLLMFAPAGQVATPGVEALLRHTLDQQWRGRYQLRLLDESCFITKNALSEIPIPAAHLNVIVDEGQQLHKPELYQPLKHYLLAHPGMNNLCLLMQHEKTLGTTHKLVELFHDFLFWPCSTTELSIRLQRLLRQPSPRDNGKLLAEFAQMNLIGESPLFMRNVQLIKKMAACHAAVLIHGETGTGKENAARAIHYLSKRREQSFVPVNCAAIPDELIESELFGHEKGAFTDAKQAQAGLVTLANGGTLFLDEVDSLSPKAQAALLRFLQTQEYRPLGGKQTLHADVRILAATNADLVDCVRQKRFREDLYFRLNVLSLLMPPLRERRNDIPLLTTHLLNRFAEEYQTPRKQISSAHMHFLLQQQWPGNIRELENCLLRAFVLSAGNYLEFIDATESAITEEDTDNSPLQTGFAEAHTLALTGPTPTSMSLSFQDAKAIAITRFESEYLQNVMRLTHGNVSAAARIAGKERRALGKLLQKYAIDKHQFQTASV